MICPVELARYLSAFEKRLQTLGFETSRAIPAAELERIMKVQDVILKAIAKKITCWRWPKSSADRTMQRMRERYQEHGYDGMFDQRRKKERHCGS